MGEREGGQCLIGNLELKHHVIPSIPGLKAPVIERVSSTHLDNIVKPVIYVCKSDQFNYTKGLQFISIRLFK